jgi:hypothetical protein
MYLVAFYRYFVHDESCSDIKNFELVFLDYLISHSYLYKNV